LSSYLLHATNDVSEEISDMRVQILGLAFASLLMATVPSLAQDNGASCEALAASPLDPATAAGTGIERDDLDVDTALPACQAAAMAADATPHDHYLYGRVLQVSGDFNGALAQYGIAAEGGLSMAINSLGEMYEYGDGVTADNAQALAFYEQAYEIDRLPVAAMNLGYFSAYGVMGEPDYEKAVAYLTVASDGGIGWATNELGIMYDHGRGVEQDLAKAADYYKTAYKNGDAYGAANLGYLYETGRGVEQNEVEAVRLYEIAVAGGSSNAMVNLGVMYEEGRGGLEQSGERAIELALQGAEAGDPMGWSNAGSIYSHGTLVPQDLTKARELMQKAADSDSTRAQGAGYNGLAWSYVLEGTNYKQALSLAKKAVAAEPEIANYMDTLGWLMHLQGNDAGALPHFEEALALSPEDPSIQAHAGDVYAALGQTENARKAYEAFVELAPAIIADPTIDIEAAKAWLAAN
jgi:TPR repeat protein